MTNKIFILTESIDEGVTRMWHFQVANQYEMAKLIIANLAHYDQMDLFEGISWRSGLYQWRNGDLLTPETLLKAIKQSFVDGDSESRFQIHALELSQNGKAAVDVTWTSEAELASLKDLC